MSDAARLLRAEHFLAENGFLVHFANHHGAHGLAALLDADREEALIFTVDGIGDSIRRLFGLQPARRPHRS